MQIEQQVGTIVTEIEKNKALHDQFSVGMKTLALRTESAFGHFHPKEACVGRFGIYSNIEKESVGSCFKWILSLNEGKYCPLYLKLYPVTLRTSKIMIWVLIIYIPYPIYSTAISSLVKAKVFGRGKVYSVMIEKSSALLHQR